MILLLSGCLYGLGRATLTPGTPVPLDIVHPSNDNRWYTPVEVHGEPWLWFVDTGYSYTTCDDGLITALGLTAYGKVPTRGELGVVVTQKAKLPPLILGGHRFDGLVCQVRDLHRTSSIQDPTEVPIAGVLGMDIFRSFQVHIDPAKGTIVLHPKGSVPPLSAANATVRLRRELGFGMRAVLPLKVDNKTFRPIVDTGTTQTHLCERRLDRQPIRVRRGVVVRGTGGSGTATRDISYYQLEELHLGTMRTPGLVVSGRARCGGLLGLNLLSRYEMVLDFPAGWASFRPTVADRMQSWTTWHRRGLPHSAHFLRESSDGP